MKKLGILFASVFLLGLVFQSCNNGKTYAEMKEEEREAEEKNNSNNKNEFIF